MVENVKDVECDEESEDVYHLGSRINNGIKALMKSNEYFNWFN